MAENIGININDKFNKLESNPTFIVLIKAKNKKPGATPKVTMSARESSCAPISDWTFNNLAAKPSRKSNTVAISINITPIVINSVGLSPVKPPVPFVNND